MNLPIYLDNHATTRIDPRVLDAMMPYLTEAYGNAASHSHSLGWAAEQAVETARAQVAKLIGASEKDIVFTSGATESNNLALKGAVEACGAGNLPHIVIQPTEHKAVLDPCDWLQKRGCRVTILAIGRDGRIELDQLRGVIERDPPLLVSIMAANNEIGTLQPISEIGALCRERDVIFHTDAAQAAGKLPIDVQKANIDLLSISGHKLYGPKGVGALYVRRRSSRPQIAEQMHGGRHERGMRSGTLNVPGIVGLGAACAIAAEEMEEETHRIAALRDRLQAKLLAGLDQVQVNGSHDHRLPGNLNMTFRHVDSESLMMGLRDIALSSGSACSSAAMAASHVLRAIGLTDEEAHSTLRFGVGRFNTQEEIDFTAERIVSVVGKLRELSPAYAGLG